MKKRDLRKLKDKVLKTVDGINVFDGRISDETWEMFKERVKMGDRKAINEMFKVAYDLTRSTVSEVLKAYFDKELDNG